MLVQITGYANDKYVCHCYDAHVEINGNWASWNELKNLDNAAQAVQHHRDRVLGKTLTIESKEFKIS
jgi:hypothetical protein